MKNTLLLLCLTFLTACGKSPLQLIKSHETSVITGLESEKTFKTTNQSLNLNWLSPINSIDEGHSLLIVKKNNTATDLPLGFKIFLWMPTMGHGSSPVMIKKLGTGIYELSQIYFIMDGFWQLKIQLTSGTSVTDEQSFEFNL